MENIFASVPDAFHHEVVDELLNNSSVRVERILSKGHSSDEDFWYDQAENEWVVVVRGAGTILFADDREVHLHAGDYINIPAHTKHRVTWTDPDVVTLWLAIFYP
ncbi:MAG: cupin domain-containing protein [Desulfuromonas sp.]|nr:cupin domain-containing protein [Desulfuromonas sp.]